MNYLENVNLYQITRVDPQIKIESLLGTETEKLTLAAVEIDNFVKGDIVLLIKNKQQQKLAERIAISYPVHKVKGRFSDLKEYEYLKMKILYDFNLHYLDKREIEAVAKDPLHLEFEKELAKNKAKIKELITYNQDEKVTPFNHTNYPVAKILNSKKIFRQEEGLRFDWGWSLMEIYQLSQEEFVSFKQSSYFRERQRGEYFKISKKAVEFMRDFPDDKDDFLD